MVRPNLPEVHGPHSVAASTPAAPGELSRRSVPLTALDRFVYDSFQPRIQCRPLPGTANGGTAPPLHLILYGIPLRCPGRGDAPGFGPVTEQPGIDGSAPFL